MNKKLALVGFIGFTVLFGCSQVSQNVEAGSEEWFKLVNSENHDYTSFQIFIHEDTGCYYTTTKNSNSGGIVQMLIEKDGVSIPYCEK